MATINSALFGPPKSPYTQTGFSALLSVATGKTGGIGETMTPDQVSQIQAFLQYWGLIEAQALMLGVEYYNYYDDSYLAGILSGFAPVFSKGGWPVCKDSGIVSACTALSNIAGAWPDTLYSDEIGQTGSSVAVNAFPGGLVVPADTPCASTGADKDCWNLTRNETSLNPATWLALYWSLGAKANCGAREVADHWLTTDGDCNKGPNFSTTWSDVDNNPSPMTMTASTTLTSGIYWGTSSIGYTDTATRCALGRPYYASALCQFNAAGFNPENYDSESTTYPNGTVTFATGQPVVTTASDHGMAAGDAVIFWADSSGLPDGITADTTYYVLTTPTATTFTVAATAGGSPVEAQGTCPGSCYFYSTVAKKIMSPNLAENYKSPKVAHTRTIDLSVDSKALASPSTRMTAAQTELLLNGMQCDPVDNPECPDSAASAALRAKQPQDAGFFTADGVVTQYLWYQQNLNANATCQNNWMFEYPQKYSYAYNSYGDGVNGATKSSGELRLPTNHSSISVADLINRKDASDACKDNSDEMDPPHSCWGQGALQYNVYRHNQGWGISNLNSRQACDTPFYYNTNPGFKNQTNVNTMNPDAKRFDSFVLGRTWWPNLANLLLHGPPGPLTVEDDLSFENPVAPAPPTSVVVTGTSGNYTVAWDQPASSGSGGIVYYTVVANGSYPCEVAATSAVSGTSAKTFATCAIGGGKPSVTVTAFNSVGLGTGSGSPS